MANHNEIVVFGATGYTGGLTVDALLRRGIRPVIAARSRDKLEQMSQRLGGLEIRTADVSRPDSLQALVTRGDVLISTVGPFKQWGRPTVETAVSQGAHYIRLLRRRAIHRPGVARLQQTRPRRGLHTVAGVRV